MGPRLSKCFTRKYDYEPNRKSEDDDVRYRNADDSVPVMRYETVSYIVPPADLKKLMEMTVDDEPTSSNTITKADGSVSKQDKDVTKENGTAVIQEADAKTQDEDATKENGTATIQKGDAKQQDEDVTKENGTASTQEGDTKQKDVDLTKENGTATIQEDNAQTQDEDATKENGTTTIQEGYAKKQAEDVIIQDGVETEPDGILVSKDVTGLNGDVKKEPDVETETDTIVVTTEAADIDVVVQKEDESLPKDDEIVAKDSIEETEATDKSTETDAKEIKVVDNTPIMARQDDVLVQENGIEGEVTSTTTNKSEDKEEGDIDHVTSETKVALQTDKDSFVSPSSSIMPKSGEIGLASGEQTNDSDAER